MDLTTPRLIVSDFRIRFGLFYVFWVDFYDFEEYLLKIFSRHPASVTFILNFFEE